MKRYLALILLTGLFACAPGTQPTVERDGDTVTARINVEKPLYLASLILAHENGTPLTREHVTDPRCVEGRVEGLALYMACDLNTLQGGETASVIVVSADKVMCLAGGYEGASALSYRTAPCKVAD